MPKTITVDRTWLHNELWRRPAIHIAIELGVSLYHLLKAADAWEIPRPQRGHWTRVRHGKAKEPPALPEGDQFPPPWWSTRAARSGGGSRAPH